MKCQGSDYLLEPPAEPAPPVSEDPPVELPPDIPPPIPVEDEPPEVPVPEVVPEPLDIPPPAEVPPEVVPDAPPDVTPDVPPDVELPLGELDVFSFLPMAIPAPVKKSTSNRTVRILISLFIKVSPFAWKYSLKIKQRDKTFHGDKAVFPEYALRISSVSINQMLVHPQNTPGCRTIYRVHPIPFP